MLLVITGHQRSGTTLLMRLCNSHPRVSITGEFGNLWELNIPYPDYARFILKRWWQKRNAAFIYTGKKQVKGANMLQNLGLATRYLRAIYAHRAPLIGPAQIEAALKNLSPQAEIVGDKYPDYAFRLKSILGSDQVKCLFIYRDPRDVASSSVKRARTDWQKSWPNELQKPAAIAQRWVTFAQAMERFPDHVYPVRYELLVSDPRATMNNIGAWLGVDPLLFRHEIVRVDSIGKHKSGLSDQEIAEVLSIAGPTMERLGYSV